MSSLKSRSKLADTDLCVMCGMCLPHCPTYQLYQSEVESPRGRIALMQSIDQGRIAPDKKAMTHIDHCLGCLNCQTICPSRVPYGRLIDEFREQYQADISKPLLSRQILKRLQQPAGLSPLLDLAMLPGLKQLLAVCQSILGTPSIHIDKASTTLQTYYPASGTERGEVSLFTGCLSSKLDSQTLLDTAELLNLAGYSVHIPARQSCCGALHQHNGQQQTAAELRDSQLTHFDAAHPILFFSPACGHSLQQSGDSPFTDARLFLLKVISDSSLQFTPSTETAALHESCSHRNLLQGGSMNHDLLSLIPDIKLLTSRRPTLCCGAAGIQSLNYPEQGQQLGEAKLASFELEQVNTLLSDNIGCSMHLKSLLRAYNPEIEVLHPIRFLRRHVIQP